MYYGHDWYGSNKLRGNKSHHLNNKKLRWIGVVVTCKEDAWCGGTIMRSGDVVRRKEEG